MAAVAFINLLVNSVFSLAAGLLVVCFFIWFFRIENGPWKLAFLSFPFLKIIYDFMRGLPQDSILYSGLDPFTLPPKHHLLRLDTGFGYWGPTFNASFSVKDINGQEFATSIGDHLAIWLQRTYGEKILLVILFTAIAVAILFLVSRIRQIFQFESRRKSDRIDGQELPFEFTRKEHVDIYISKAFSGSPFTGGTFKPYICIPWDAYQKLDPEELGAVIAHEIGHIRQFDLLITIFIQILGDLFWFIPGYRLLNSKIDRLREIVADQWAVRSGIDPLLLASALLKLKDIPEPADRTVLYSAFFRQKSLLKTRIELLLGKTANKIPRFGWQFRWLRVIVAVWTFTAVMLATLGGNRSVVYLAESSWLDNWLRFFGV